MRKIVGFFKTKLKIVSFLSIILLIVCVNIVRVNADYMDEKTEGNKKEQQILDKIDAIKEAFPKQIDKEALYATLAHRGTFTDYVEQSYDENFDKDEYGNEMNEFATNISNLGNNILDNIVSIWDYLGSILDCVFCNVDDTDNDGEECSYGDFQGCVINGMINRYVERKNSGSEGQFVTVEGIKTPQNIDLLMAATIVMLDSSGWTGSYSDDNYKKALAGDGLVGNMFDKYEPIQNAMSTVMNGVFCAVGQTFDLTVNWFNPGINFGENGNFTIEQNAMAGKLSRFYTMSNICKYGFVGGTYEHVKYPDLSTEEGKKQYQGKKDIVAEQIINLAKEFRGDELENCVYYGTTGNYSNWKQYDSQWGSEAVGDSTVKSIGCTTTSIAIQIARSGTKITNIPSPYTEFNPGALAKSLSQNGGYSGNLIAWGGFGEIAPNVHFQPTQQFKSSNEGEIAKKMLEVLQTPVDDKYQPFILLQMRHNGGEHWVAVQGVENNQVIINDPGRDGNTLSGNYSGEVWQVESYKVMYATDVPFGSEYSSGSSISGGNTYDDSCNTATSGDIVIPEEFGNGIFTYTTYNGCNWIYNQKKVYDLWASSGAEWDDGIAVIDGRYLIACTETFGQVGDKVDFFLEDGTRIPCIIADIKSSSDAGYNKWGHSNGQSVLEFEVSVEAAKHYGDNVGNNGWHMEWANKRVASATNLGENVIGL